MALITLIPSETVKEGRFLPKRKSVSGWEPHDEEFVKNAAHELRTPVSAISSAIGVLQNRAKETRRNATGS